jgi:hypothetical protein
MTSVFLIHGTAGHPNENWFPWLYEQLSKRGALCFVPHFPTLIKQSYNNWSLVLDAYRAIGLIDENCLFVTHSLGSIFVARYLQEKQVSAKAFISIAGFNQFGGGNVIWDTLNKDFFIPDVNLRRFKDLVSARHCFMSKNDPYLPFEQLEKFAKATDSRSHIIDKAGHFNTAAGFTEFRAVLEVIEQELHPRNTPQEDVT